MIYVYPAGANTFKDGALAVIFPTVCTVSKTAAAEWSLHLEIPVDLQDTRWQSIQTMNIIKAPVPPETLPAISAQGNIIGTDWYDVYKLTSAAALYSDTGGSGQRKANYPAFATLRQYTSGDKCSYGGNSWQAQSTFEVSRFEDGNWKQISNYISYTIPPTDTGTTTAADTEIKLLDIVTSNGTEYLHGTTITGAVTGYWLLSKATYVRTESSGSSSAADIEARTIREQCFRIKSVVNDGKTVTAEAMHLSYDYAGMLMYLDCDVEDKTVTQAVAKILDARAGIALDNNRPGFVPLIACQPTGNKVTADYTGQNLIHCLLDPDEGLVAQAKARLLRDNWNFYLLTNGQTDRGFRVEYAGNMTGVNWEIDASDIILAIIPTAKYADDSTLYCDPPPVYSDNASMYPLRPNEIMKTNYKEGVDGTVAEVRALMAADAAKRFTVDHADQLREKVTVEFVQLGDTEQYAQFRNLRRVSLYDTVHVSHPNIGLEVDLQVTGYEWDALRERMTSITVGDVTRYPRPTVAGYQIKNGSITAAKIR